MNTSTERIFNYTWFRTYIGVVALSIAFGCFILHNVYLPEGQSFQIPQSISATYHSGARDFFVAQLFVVAAFLVSYKGHNCRERSASLFAGISAMLIAWFPTSCEDLHNCEIPSFFFISNSAETNKLIHYFAAVIFFVLLVYICYQFYKRARDKWMSNATNKAAKRRKIVYFFGAFGMIFTILIGLIWLVFDKTPPRTLVFWVELICLVLFGIVWLVAGKSITFAQLKEVLHCSPSPPN